MPDEKEKKQKNEKKQPLSTEITVGITNEQQVAYSSNEQIVLNIVDASLKRTEEQHGIGFSCGFKYTTPLTLNENQHFDEEGNLCDEQGNIIADSETLASLLVEHEGTIHYGCKFNEHVDFQYKYDFQNLFDINVQRASKNDVSTICSNMKNFIMENKDTNPEKLQIAIGTLQTASYLYYDFGTNNILKASGYTRKDLGNTSEEVIEKIYNTPKGDMLEGFVCCTISDFVMRLLHECNIEAVMFAGGDSGSDHTTLLYKQSDGKYVFVDEGNFAEIDAPSIKDAAKAINRSITSPGDFGYIMFIDENNSYQEYDLADETIWGYELDKRDYNQTYAQLPVIEGEPSVRANYNRSIIGGNEIDLTKTTIENKENNVLSQKKISIGYKNNKFDNFNTYSYNSFGAKYEKTTVKPKDDNVTTYKNNKTILSTTKIDYNAVVTAKSGYLNTELHSYDSMEEVQANLDESLREQLQNSNIPEELKQQIWEDRVKVENIEMESYYRDIEYERVWDDPWPFLNFMLFNRNERGIQTKINDNLSTTGQVSSTVGLNTRPLDGLVFCGDLRLTAEQSLNYHKTKGKSEFQTNLNAGIVTDMSIKTGVLKPGVAVGGKGNADVSIMTKLNDNVSVGANTSGYVVATPVSTDYGAMGGVVVNYKKNGNTVFGRANAGCEKQDLHIGLLNERTENNLGVNAVLGIKNNNGSAQVGYNSKFDKLNPTKNRSTFSVGVNFYL